MNGSQRGSLTKNIRSLFVNWMRPRTLRCSSSVDLEARHPLFQVGCSKRLDINEARALIAEQGCAGFRGRNRRGQKQGFQTHLHETENHVKRLEQVSQLAELKAQGVGCPASTASLRKPMRSRAKSSTSPFSMQPSSRQRRRSSITRSRAKATLIS